MFLWALCPLRNPLVKHVLEIVMKSLSRHSKQRGFTLIEVGIALAIGLVIILGVASAIRASQNRATVFDLVNQVQAHTAAAIEYRMANGHSYTGMDQTKMIALGYDLSTDITVTLVGTAGQQYSLSLPDVGDAIMAKVNEKVNDTYDQDGTDKKLFKSK